ncbi:MAG: 50S ribosomal protein L1 [Alphaproteobacteria bacterium]|nr:50S ribosomal protein L1 [Alphaproteobacteria bacterium]
MSGKKMKKAYEGVERNKFYGLAEAVKILQTAAKARKFDETIDVSINLGIDTKQPEQNVRGMIELPHGTGAKIRVAAFVKDDKAAEAKKAGADIVGAEDLGEKIMKGEINFDRLIATPDMMPLMAKLGLGKVLGPKGLMPNPKLGTVTTDITKAVESAKAGSVEYRNEKAGVVQAGVGKASFDAKKLEENVKAFVAAIQRAKPAGVKGVYMKKVSISSTMGPGLKLDLSNFSAEAAQKAA